MKMGPRFRNHTSNVGMVAKQASTKRTSLILGYESDKTQLASEPFYNRQDEQGFKSNVERTKLSPQATQANANG